MELLAGAAFAESVDPFPEPSAASVCHQGSSPAAVVGCPGEGVHCRRPKLKPIRCAPRSPPEDGSERPGGAGAADAADGKPGECGLGSGLMGSPASAGLGRSPARFCEESWWYGPF
ncbi:hypothetical protein BT93_D1118 [Corymbia citriodora subsp. variegata]|nr:hypothetical protein BT93_D1118 [Corymbia citriodora subsp. variegata]